MTISQQVNKNITKAEYFNNNGKGFNSPHVIEVEDLNIKVEVYSHNLRASKVANIESEIRETATNFKNAFELERGSSEQTFKIYMFDDKDDYTHLGGSERFGSYLGDEGGKCYYKGKADVFAEMYVYQQGGIHNLQHEFAHGLTYLATGGKSLPTVLMEGIADYFEHHSDHKFNSQGSSIDKTEAANLDLDKILSLEYSKDSEANSLVYKTGHALIMYLQEKDPSLLRDYLDALRQGNSDESKSFLKDIKGHDTDFKSWLAENDTETAMEHLNALQVTKGDFIAIGQEIVGGEIKNVSYYKANIEKMDGENVGSFSPVEHVAFYDVARAINRATNDTLDISKEYHFLKVVKTSDGQDKLTYSDQQGNEYRNSLEYKNQAFRMLSKYDENLKKAYDDALKNLDEQRQMEYPKINKEYSEGKISYEEYSDKYYSIPSKYEELKSTLLDKTINTGLEQVKATKNIDVEKMLGEMINIDSNLIRGTNHIDLQEGKIFSMQAHGQGDMGALSIYDGNTKLGELLSESGFFKQVEGQTKETFVFEDILHNLNVSYEGGAYMAVTKENGHYKASLIDGRTVERDEYFDEAHLHENELLHPSTGHIQKDLDSLLLRGTKILNHQDSEHAQYSDEQKANGVIVEKGKLLNNKGTDRTDDDVYEAVVKQGDERLHEFKNMGFYITEKGDLFIHDHGANVRFQLPQSITHLKLVEKDGAYKLVPVTKDGNEHPVGMPNISDEYRYIDPIFAHEYEKRDYSHKHVNVGLINLEKYGSGKLFAIKYDPNDYHIQRNSSGEIVRIKDQTYFTKVKLFDGDEEIGMLSNNFHNFKGKIFFSADYNYSYNDFLASVSPQVEIEDMGNGSKKITFDQGSGDIGDTNRGYTDYQRIFTKEKQTESPKGQVSETKTEVHSTTNVVAQAAEEKTASNDNSEMQSDQPQIPTRAKRSASVEEKEQEQVVLKDTILKIEKSYEQDSEGKHKANVTINYNDVKALYDRAEGAEKQSVLDFWNKLHTSDYKVGALPEDKYYFEKGKFVIHDSGTKKLIVLPEDKVSIKIMKDGDSYSLAISSGNGKVINSISKIDNPNYELLSDSSHFNSGEQDNIVLSDQHHEYNLYLENGFVKMFDCASDHIYHDHNSAYI
ncbi:surface protein-related protein [Wolbachia endosymbiont of Drosophila melanogaster]|uniref:peptidase M2 n=8 Tax=Wolbachieae TaxID=952 RepID=UPI000023BBEC|nr:MULTISPECIES: peptidase M2 [Wolbachia]AAS14698.1 surface protein-related protein [Wolbachia endosymbiont of Drosophila melanogaster]ERN55288.1 surface protein-related protein [Wolbachia pipientis wMelPop]MCE4149954.1 peptidase M2 [Wolbachia endosymbiont of Drosophila melanogaster]MCE4150552.1 peptidase M2 [Wolbachia endosymbiont of Drosophila melanogaster]POG49723.1 peptidase M2 [Wolbachia sp. wMel_AMD]